MSMKKCIFVQKFLLLLIFLLNFAANKGDNEGRKVKRESNYLQNPITVVGDYKYGYSRKDIGTRQSAMANRDSYLDAANSSPAGQGDQGHGHKNHATAAYSYQVPQNSYDTPSMGYSQNSNSYGYGMEMQQGGYYDHDDYPQSTKGGGEIGLIGLLGLKGLKGLIPLIKLFGLTLLALTPLLFTLMLLKIPLFLLKPVIAFAPGRSLFTGDKAQNTFKMFDHLLANFNSNVSSENNTRFNVTSTDDDVILLRELLTLGVINDKGMFGRELEMGNQCMQRIACEGLFKSLPRIFLRIIGENYPYKKLRKRRNIKEDEKEQDTFKSSRRKDLATLALKKLKNPYFLTKHPSLIHAPETTEACRLYKCETLF